MHPLHAECKHSPFPGRDPHWISDNEHQPERANWAPSWPHPCWVPLANPLHPLGLQFPQLYIKLSHCAPLLGISSQAQESCSPPPGRHQHKRSDSELKELKPWCMVSGECCASSCEQCGLQLGITGPAPEAGGGTACPTLVRILTPWMHLCVTHDCHHGSKRIMQHAYL